jgi:hypothetical protein
VKKMADLLSLGGYECGSWKNRPGARPGTYYYRVNDKGEFYYPDGRIFCCTTLYAIVLAVEAEIDIIYIPMAEQAMEARHGTKEKI